MKAVLVDDATHELSIGEVPDPVPGDDDLLVRVKATALNRADLLQRVGKYPPPPGASEILGLEMAGVVERVGKNVRSWSAGDRVSALLPGGGYAQKVVVPQGMAMAVPEGLSWTEAASIPEVFLTAYLNLIVLGRLSAGEHVLIHAAASGVGTASIQLAKEIGAIPIATAGSAEKLAACAKLGARHVINYRDVDFAERVLELTDRRGAGVILDPVGGSYWEKNMRVIARDGRWIIIGGLGGYTVERLDIRALMGKRVQLHFSTLRSRSESNKVELTQGFAAFASDRFERGTLRPVVDRVFDWRDVTAAHQYMKENRNIGKIVLTVGD